MTSTNLEEQTIFDGGYGHGPKLNPGNIKGFGLYYSNHTSGQDIKLQMTNIISQNVAEAKSDARYHRYLSGGTTQVNIGWSINMYAKNVTALTDHKPTTSTDYSAFFASQTGDASGPGSVDRIILSSTNTTNIGKNGETSVPLSSVDDDHPVDLYPTTATSASEGYIFFTLVFSNDATVLCKEKDGNEDALLPKADSTSYDRIFVTNNAQNPETGVLWNSNCYADLKFAVTKMNFVF